MIEKKYLYEEDGVISVEITPSNIENAVVYIKNSGVKAIFFETANKNEFKNYSFLNRINSIEEISIIGDSVTFESFPIQKNIKKIYVSGHKGKIDLTCFPNLLEATIDWNNKLYFGSIDLNKLILWKYNPKSKTLAEISNIRNLSELELNQSNINSLDGVEKLKNLKSIEMHYCSKLEDISNICELKKLTKVLIDNARKINNHSAFSMVNSLEILILNSCGIILNIAFIENMNKLKEFRFVDTIIKDGDLTPCLRLKKVSFNNKKHYSHKLEEIKAIIS